jgi:prepilin-type N-terminal cleavage/methylation domain-containing protein
MPCSLLACQPAAKRAPARDSSPTGDDGFTLLEVVVSLALFAVIAVAATLGVINALKYSESNENRVVAAGLAAAQIEQARAVKDPKALTAGTATIHRNGTSFMVSQSLSPSTGCSADGRRVITVSVNWSGTGGPVRSDTVRLC